MAQTFNLGKLTLQAAHPTPCLRATQYMKNEPITCDCDACLRDNAGLTQQQIRARMDKAYNVKPS